MKKLSLKTRLVLLHTGLMAVVLLLVLWILFSVSSREILSNVQNDLEKNVSEAGKYVEYEDGRLEFDSDLLELENGVYLSVYEPEGELLYGTIPYGFSYGLAFSDGELRQVSSGGTVFYVLDMEYPVEGYHPLIFRGIASVSDAERDFRFTVYLALLLSPVLLFLTAFCGYILSRRALRPVSRITGTVREIQREQDLSRRIRLGEGRDEIYTLAETFDSLLDTIEEGVNREKQFTDDAAHELRTPISVILLQCEEILEKELDPQVREGIGLIQKKARAMSEMLSQLLLLSRADGGRQKLEEERLDLGGLAQVMAEEFGGIAGEKQISIETELEDGAYIMADETLMIRMWSNLLQNAVSYGKTGGHIWIRVYRDGEEIAASVRDDGMGIREEDLPKIWDLFYRADPARSSEGNGLGLSMVRWIVRAHRGEITVRSRYGEGSTFAFRFPAA